MGASTSFCNEIEHDLAFVATIRWAKTMELESARRRLEDVGVILTIPLVELDICRELENITICRERHSRNRCCRFRRGRRRCGRRRGSSLKGLAIVGPRVIVAIVVIKGDGILARRVLPQIQIAIGSIVAVRLAVCGTAEPPWRAIRRHP